jgi:hypothetical protein
MEFKKSLPVLFALHHIKSFLRLQDFRLTDQKLTDAIEVRQVGVYLGVGCKFMADL